MFPLLLKDLHSGFYTFIRPFHTFVVRFQHMRLDKQAWPVPQGSISLRKHGWGNIVDQPAFGIMPSAVSHISSRRKPAVQKVVFHFRNEIIFCPARKPRIHIAVNFDKIGKHVLVIGPVGSVDVDKKLGHPVIEKFKPGLHFVSFRLEKIPVQV